MKKDYKVTIEDNGAAFLIVINPGTAGRLVVASCDTLGDAWRYIDWMYAIESQDFVVTNNKHDIPVGEWIAFMRKAGFLEGALQ